MKQDPTKRFHIRYSKMAYDFTNEHKSKMYDIFTKYKNFMPNVIHTVCKPKQSGNSITYTLSEFFNKYPTKEKFLEDENFTVNSLIFYSWDVKETDFEYKGRKFRCVCRICLYDDSCSLSLKIKSKEGYPDIYFFEDRQLQSDPASYFKDFLNTPTLDFMKKENLLSKIDAKVQEELDRDNKRNQLVDKNTKIIKNLAKQILGTDLSKPFVIEGPHPHLHRNDYFIEVYLNDNYLEASDAEFWYKETGGFPDVISGVSIKLEDDTSEVGSPEYQEFVDRVTRFLEEAKKAKTSTEAFQDFRYKFKQGTTKYHIKQKGEHMISKHEDVVLLAKGDLIYIKKYCPFTGADMGFDTEHTYKVLATTDTEVLFALDGDIITIPMENAVLARHPEDEGEDEGLAAKEATQTKHCDCKEKDCKRDANIDKLLHCDK